ncbi:serine/threonine-protein kinase [Streptomyces sp. NPDC002044]|uniref:serine/threonine-protein kinase n=1 Tax=Streptomyces sp. NPDC002044 TaxID=3154662 RepID=UPI003327FCFD
MDDVTTEVFRPLLADDPRTVAGYRLAARIGAGGMGRVYLSHTQGGRPVAIKVVRPELAEDPAFKRRFRREVEAARRVRGAYTAELIDAEADGVPPWLATLYVPGPSLSQAVARSGPLPVAAVLWLMAGVAEALQAIHGAGIVHRDLKPSNVLLAADGPRVIDFGISLASGTTTGTATHSAIGTPQYMAPEQASEGEVTAATDVFALGQTAAFAALGRPLYGDGPSMSVLFRIVHSDPDLSLLPEPLRPLLARCLAPDPADRATPAEIVAWCRQRLGGDADAGGGPAVWREVTGPEVVTPGPLHHPTPVRTTPVAGRSGTRPEPGSPPPPAPAPAPPGPQERRRRGRRTALIVGAAVTAWAVLLAGLGWMVMDGADRLRDRAAARTAPGAVSGAATGGTAKGAAPEPSAPSTPEAPRTPAPRPYPMVRLGEGEDSVSFREPVRREDRTGDLRLACTRTTCALESDSSVIALLLGEPRGSLDTCRFALREVESRSVTLAAAAAGSEFCVKHPSGDIALLVIQVKSVVRLKGLPDWVTADMTVWPAS